MKRNVSGWIVGLLMLVIGWVSSRLEVSREGVFARVGRWWIGLVPDFMFLRLIPDIRGGSDGLAAQGSYLLMATNAGESPNALIEISEVISIAGGGGTTERIDFTHLRSPGNRREWKPSFIDSGQLNFTVQYIPTDASHQQILAYLDSQEEFVMREVFPDGNGWDYFGYIEAANKSGQDVGGKLQLECVYKINGVIDFTGSGSPN